MAERTCYKQFLDETRGDTFLCKFHHLQRVIMQNNAVTECFTRCQRQQCSGKLMTRVFLGLESQAS